MSIARHDDGPQAQLLVLDSIRLITHYVLPLQQVGVDLPRPSKKGSSYGGQVSDPIHAQQLYGVLEDGLQVPHDHLVSKPAMGLSVVSSLNSWFSKLPREEFGFYLFFKYVRTNSSFVQYVYSDSHLSKYVYCHTDLNECVGYSFNLI